MKEMIEWRPCYVLLRHLLLFIFGGRSLLYLLYIEMTGAWRR